MNFENLTRVDFRVASGGAGGKVELRMDSPTGATFASADVAPTGGWQNWTTVSAPITNPPQGTHVLYIVFTHPTDDRRPDEPQLVPGPRQGRRGLRPAGRHRDGHARHRPGAAQRQVQRDGDRPRGRGADLPVGLRRHRHVDRHVDPGGPDVHLRERRHLHGQGHGDRRRRASGRPPRSTCASTGAPNQCDQNAKSDEFNGNSLDLNRWTVRRSLDNFNVTNGELVLPIDNGSIYQGGTSAGNIITQPTPSGTWTVTAKVRVAELNQNYQQAGLRVYSDDDNWASVHMISAGGNRDVRVHLRERRQPAQRGGRPLGGAARRTRRSRTSCGSTRTAPT